MKYLAFVLLLMSQVVLAQRPVQVRALKYDSTASAWRPITLILMDGFAIEEGATGQDTLILSGVQDSINARLRIVDRFRKGMVRGTAGAIDTTWVGDTLTLRIDTTLNGMATRHDLDSSLTGKQQTITFNNGGSTLITNTDTVEVDSSKGLLLTNPTSRAKLSLAQSIHQGASPSFLGISAGAGGVSSSGDSEFGNLNVTNQMSLEVTPTWSVLYQNGTPYVDGVAMGDSGKVFMSNGPAAAPSWQTAGGGSGDIEGVTAGDGIQQGGTSGTVTVTASPDFDGGLETVDDSLNVKLYGTTLATDANGLRVDTAVVTGTLYKMGLKADKATTMTIAGTTPLSSSAGAQDLSTNRTWTLSIANAAADGATLGAASFNATYFDASSGNISPDFTNGLADDTQAGWLSAGDWDIFNSKVDGSFTSGRVPYANGTSSLTSVAGFEWNNTNKQFYINSGAAPTYSQQIWRANGAGAFSVLVYSVDNANMGFDVDFSGGNWIARDASVALLNKISDLFLIRGSAGNSVGGAATLNNWTSVDLTTGVYGVGIGSTTASARIHSNELTIGNPVLRLSSTATNDDPVLDVIQNRVTTTDATVTTIHTYAVAQSKQYGARVEVVARRTGGSSGTANDGGYYAGNVAFRNVSGTVTVNGVGTAIDIPVVYENQAAWAVDVIQSGTNIIVRVTGAANNNVTWHLSKFEVTNVGS